MYLIITSLTLCSSLIIGFFGFYLGRQVSILLSLLSLFISFLISILIFYEVVLCQSVTTIVLYNWVSFSNFKLHIGFLFDELTSIMLFLILIISLLVHIYSAGYMSHDPYIIRFLSYLGLFTFFMIILVTADNFLQLFVGWEGVGLCSYLLINFWHTRILANKAALKAMIMNRIADVFFILGIVLIILTFKTADYLIVFNLLDHFTSTFIYIFFFKIKVLDLIAFFLFIGAIGKSAQIGLHTWLPDAMEGPTPVSALLHAATMVTAGVFLLIRCSSLFEMSLVILNLVAVIGGLTALFSALVACFQFDIKKIVAYSTCSQLGYMFFSCGLSNYNIALFHLFNHAFFKAALFLGAGCIISSLLDEQDIRKMGEMARGLPLTYITLLIGSLAITGFPFLTGFYSKDLVLEVALTRYVIDSYFVYVMGISAAFFTAFYSIRLIIYVFYMTNNKFFINRMVVESNYLMLIPLFVLSFMSIVVGFLFSDLYGGWGSPFLNHYVLQTNFVYIDNEFLSPFLKNLPLIISFFGFFAFFGLKGVLSKTQFRSLNFFFFYAGYFNFLFNFLFIAFYKKTYFLNTKILDKGFLELIGPFGVYKGVYNLSLFLRNFTPNVIFLSIGYIFLALFILISFIFFKNINIALLMFSIVIFLDEVKFSRTS